jgi:mercuric ion binding protein
VTPQEFKEIGKMTLHPLRGTLFVLILGILVSSASARAQVVGATVAIDGMSCPFCAFGVEKRLKKVEGVASVEVEMGQGLALLTGADGESIAYSQIPDAVRKSGFTPGGITLTAVGGICT